MSTPEGENPDIIIDSLPDPTPPTPPQEEEGTETPDIPYQFVSSLIRYKKVQGNKLSHDPMRPPWFPFNIGYHFWPNIANSITIAPGMLHKIPLGIDIAIPPCHYGRFITLNQNGSAPFEYSNTTSVLGSILQPQSRSNAGVNVTIMNHSTDELVIYPDKPIVELIVESVNINNILELIDDGELGELPTTLEQRHD